MDWQDFQAMFPDVSRETFDGLTVFSEHLAKWNQRINLLSRQETGRVWERHICDSLQMVGYLPERVDHLVDIGSGGGFPGLVIALALRDTRPETRITLIDSDQRKCEFLRASARLLGLEVDVFAARILDVPPIGCDLVTARALAPVKMLLEFAEYHLSPQGSAMFLKGERYLDEVSEARKSWQFSCDSFPSLSHPNAAVLKIGEIERV